MANWSRSENVAPLTIWDDQSSIDLIGSLRIVSILSLRISTRLSSIRCQAFEWAYTGCLFKCFGIFSTQTIRFESEVINSLIVKLSESRLEHFSTNLNLIF